MKRFWLVFVAFAALGGVTSTASAASDTFEFTIPKNTQAEMTCKIYGKWEQQIEVYCSSNKSGTPSVIWKGVGKPDAHLPVFTVPMNGDGETVIRIFKSHKQGSNGTFADGAPGAWYASSRKFSGWSPEKIIIDYDDGSTGGGKFDAAVLIIEAKGFVFPPKAPDEAAAKAATPQATTSR